MEQQIFTNESILSWLQYFAKNTAIDLEKVKMLDITRKNKNLIPTVESHRAVLVFTEAGIADMLPLDNPDRLWTIDDMTALLKAIQEKIPDVAPMTLFSKSSGGDQATRALISNIYGGETITDDLTEYTLNSPEAVKALEWVVNGVKEGYIAKGSEALTSNDAMDMYLQGKSASTIIYSTRKLEILKRC